MSKRFVALLILPMMLIMGPVAANSSAADAGVAASKGKAEISILTWPDEGVFGYVESGRKGCSTGRQVRLFERQSDGSRRLLRSKRTKKTGHGAIWWVRSKAASAGRLTAVATKTGRCARVAVSERVSGKKGDYKVCPSKGDMCYLSNTKVDDRTSFQSKACRSFGESPGFCDIAVTFGRVPICCFEAGWIRWNQKTSGHRDFEMKSYDRVSQGSPEILGPYIRGWLPNSSSPSFNVDEMNVPRFFDDPKASWYTPTLPDTTPGAPGGPLFMEWDQEYGNSFHFWIKGFLYKNK